MITQLKWFSEIFSYAVIAAIIAAASSFSGYIRGQVSRQLLCQDTIFFIRSGIKIIPSIVPSFSATNARAVAALLLFISVDTLMRHIGPVALQAACLSGEQGQQGERGPADDCSVLQSALLPFNHLPFFKLLLSWPRANRTRKLTTVSSIRCHISSPWDRRVINSAHHDVPYWLTVQIPWD